MEALIGKGKDIWGHAGFQKYFRNTGWMFFGNITYLLFSFLSVSVMARALGPENYGQLSYAMSFVAVFGFVVGLGIGNILYRELIKNPEKRDAYIGTSFVITLSSAFLAQIITVCAALLFSDPDVSFGVIFILSFSFYFNSYFIINTVFFSKINAKIPSILITAAHFMAAILKIVIVLSGKGILYIAIIMLLETVLILTSLLFFYVKKYGAVTRWTYDPKIAKSLIASGLPLMIVSAFTIIYSKIDQVMIKNMIGAEAVGHYDAAVRLSELWYFVPTTIITSLFPAMVNANAVSLEKFKGRTKQIGVFLFGFSVAISMVTVLLAPLIVYIVFGSQYIESVSVLRIYIWSLVASSMSLLITHLLIIRNKTKTVAVITFAGLFVNILLNIILIPKYGITGAAWATFVSYWVPVIAWVIVRRKWIR